MSSLRPCVLTIVLLASIVASFTTAAMSSSAVAAASLVGTVANYSGSISNPRGLAVGPDGNLWFTNSGNDSIGRITPAGVVTKFTAAGILDPLEIAAGADGNMWFTNLAGINIGRITPAGLVTLFPTQGRGITRGPDGNMWFTAFDSVGRITPAGVISTFSDPSMQFPAGIVSAPDGNLWFANQGGNSIGRITTAGVVSNYPDPSIVTPQSIAVGPDGALWFTNLGSSAIGRITTSGAISSLSGPGRIGFGITAGPDGNLWFAAGSGIGRLTPAGVLTTFSGPGVNIPRYIVLGLDGNLWFTNEGSDSIGRITSAGVVSKFPGLGPSNPEGIAAGPDGNLWFDSETDHSVERVSPAGVFTTVTDPAIESARSITAGPDGNLWFANGTSGIARMTPAGVVTNFPIVAFPRALTAGPDGNLWFTIAGSTSIGRMTTTGVETIFPGADSGLGGPRGITAGPDGNLWFTNPFQNTIVRITPSGVRANFAGVGISDPQGITVGSDGNLWFANAGNGSIGRITPAGTVSQFGSGINDVYNVAAGPDGNVWFTFSPTSIGRITTAGVISTFSDPSISFPAGIAAGPDGRMWFANSGNDSIGTITAVPPPDLGRYVGLSPKRLLDSRFGTGGFSSPWGPSVSRNLGVRGGATTVPANATAVVLNVVAVKPSLETHITVWPAGEAMPVASNINVPAGDVRANLVTVKVGLGGSVSIFNNSGSTDVLADVVGYYSPDVAGSRFTGLSPKRLLDSRFGTGGFSSPWGPSVSRNLGVRGGATTVPANATAVVLNVVAVKPSLETHLTVWPAGEAMPVASNINVPAGDVRANLVTVKVGLGGSVSIFNNSGSTDVLADVVGYYSPEVSGSLFTGVSPNRLLDSRVGTGGFSSPWPPNATRELAVRSGFTTVPLNATAVVLNVVAVKPSLETHLTVWPAGEPMPVASNINVPAGDVRANLVTVKIGAGGKVSIFNNSGSTDVVADVVGYYGP